MSEGRTGGRRAGKPKHMLRQQRKVQLVALDRTLQALALAKQGLTQQAIADQIGYKHRASAKHAIDRGLAMLRAMVDEAAEALRTRLLGEAEAVKAKLLTRLAHDQSADALAKLSGAYVRVAHWIARLKKLELGDPGEPREPWGPTPPPPTDPINVNVQAAIIVRVGRPP